jgi:hypothetical protein
MFDPGQPATVEVGVDGHTLHLTFGLPRGAEGAPGEVTTADLASAITGTSANSNGVATLGLSASGSYDASDLQAVIGKLNELITAMRRYRADLEVPCARQHAGARDAAVGGGRKVEG